MHGCVQLEITDHKAANHTPTVNDYVGNVPCTHYVSNLDINYGAFDSNVPNLLQIHRTYS